MVRWTGSSPRSENVGVILISTVYLTATIIDNTIMDSSVEPGGCSDFAKL